ncbi:condensin-2 complex subunit G2-like [Corticium candelabrum]|uniref:condensin-2 complex subunit G2-like n=1 Tax=Corticium candelabrum TaxID=121492 RepID=UPI002E26A484|nr:condensin-2 complex subunit G2-like [Corticium candelabrum]
MAYFQVQLADIKRVWALRQALCVFDFEHEDSSPLKTLLIGCVIQPQYLRSEEGVRFLAFLFGLHPALVADLHIQIKQSMPGCSKDDILSYGEVYFRAWKMATDIYLERIEYGCIQDLMHAAVHAQRTGVFSMAARLRMLLSPFHHHKQPKTDEALCRLYEPILWRAVTVSSPHVRANAATLLCDAFPLQNPNANIEETDALLNKQLDCLDRLLYDSCPLIRGITVVGVCRILQIFWEMIPVKAVNGFLDKIKSLACDSASGSVRASVFRGFSLLVKNRLTHSVLGNLLPKLHCHIHDSSQSVRIAFLDFLVVLKGLGTINFWSVVPTNHLLYRLECDGPPVTRRIMKLLAPHLLPPNKTPEDQINRCIALLQENRRAARVFFALAAGQMTVAATSRFLQVVCKSLLHLLGESDDGVDLGEDGTVETEETVVGLLEVMAVMWTVVSPKLNKGTRSVTKSHLVELFSKSIQVFLDNFKSGDARKAILVMASHLPLDAVEAISDGCLHVLGDMTSDAGVSDYGPVVECLTSWGHTKDVLDLANSWLRALLNGEKSSSVRHKQTSRSLTKKSKDGEENRVPNSGKKTEDIVVERAELAIQLVTWMMKHHRLKTFALDERTSLVAINNSLKACLDECESRLVGRHSMMKMSDGYLVDAVALYAKLSVCLIQRDDVTLSEEEDSDRDSALTNIAGLFSWAERVTLPQLHTTEQLQECSETVSAGVKSGRKRKLFTKGTHSGTLDDGVSDLTSDGGERAIDRLAGDLTEVVLMVGIDVVTTGFDTHRFRQEITGFSSKVVQTRSGGYLMPHLCRLLYQLSQRPIADEENSVPPPNGDMYYDDPVSIILQNLLKLMTQVINQERRNMLKVFSTVKPAIIECLVASHRHYMISVYPSLLSLSPMATVMMAVVADISQSLSEETMDQLPKSIEDLPPLAVFLLGAVNHITRLREFFLMQLLHAIGEEAFQTVGHLVAILNILSVLSRASSTRSSLLEVVEAVGKQLACDKFRGHMRADQAAQLFKSLKTQLS